MQEVQIGSQVWTTKNLDVEIFANGDVIPEAKSNEEWERAGREKRPAWCYYLNDADNGKKYGRMYNWYALTDPRGICPKGWHIPTIKEWITLENFLGSAEAAVLLQCEADKDKTKSNGAFCALPGGYRFKDGKFSGIGEFIYLSIYLSIRLHGRRNIRRKRE